MRLLAVRGANLTSLGAFAIELTEAPLVDSRIFAIVGPTGAGKSTLLDAICLALYDRVPRLLDAKDAAVGSDDLSPNDPRALMRKGATEAYAEVDFVDQNGARCRARWDVWRARKRTEGRIQNQRMSLTDLDAAKDLTEATKTETLRQIENRLGLSFDEFRRAVLLAQGDFAAFMRAPADERANLLEKMTGTHLFGSLSQAAHVRTKEVAEQLGRLEAEREGIEVLTPDELTALADERDRRIAERARQAANRTEAEAMLRWHEEMAVAERTAEVSDEAVGAARQAAEAAREDQQTLDRAEAAELLRGPFEAWARAEAAAQNQGRRAAEAEAAVAVAFKKATAAREGLRLAEQQHGELRARDAQQAEEIAQARNLDGRVAETNGAVDDAQRLVQAHEKTEAATRRDLDECLDRYESAASQRAKTEAWLASHAAWRPVERQWTSIQPALERGAALIERSAETENAQQRAAAQWQALLQEHARAADAEKAAAATFEHSQSELQSAQAELVALRRDVPARERRGAMETLAELRAGVERLRTLLPTARRLDRRIKEEARARRIATQHAKEARQQLEEARHQQRTAKESFERVTSDVTRAEAVQTVAQRRAELLTQGEPCPLCGSTTHPAADCEPPDNPGLSSLRARRTRLENELSQARQNADAARTALRAYRTEARDAQLRGEEAQADLDLLSKTWADGRDALKLVWLKSSVLTQRGVHKLYLAIDEAPTAKDAKAGVTTALVGLDAARKDLSAYAEKEDDALQAVERAQTRRDEHDAEHRRCAQHRATVTARMTEARHEREQLGERAEQARSEWAELRATLEPVLGPVTDLTRVQNEPAAVLTEVHERIQAFTERLVQSETHARHIAQLDDAVRAARVRADAALAQLTDARRRLEQTQARHGKLVAERAGFLNGRSIEQYESERAAAVARADADVETARSALADVETAHAAAASRHEDAQAALSETERARVDAAGSLEQKLAPSGLVRDVLSTLLERHHAGWRAETRARLQGLKDELTRAEAQAEAARERLQFHRAQGRPRLDKQQAQATLDQARSAHESEIEALGRVEERLRRHEEAKERRAALDEQVDRQRRALEQWSELNAVIGSADGKKLRTFAQGLTLENLIAQANLHLVQLRPRYRLDRIPNQDMDLMVIDRDLGDEPRALSSLSGGETFLVSLALALALSTLSARDVRIESLFIDEGFGALDGEALEIALATLDQLQAAGRTIGLISHIPDIAERIGYRVEVRPTGPGLSEIYVRGA